MGSGEKNKIMNITTGHRTCCSISCPSCMTPSVSAHAHAPSSVLESAWSVKLRTLEGRSVFVWRKMELEKENDVNEGKEDESRMISH